MALHVWTAGAENWDWWLENWDGLRRYSAAMDGMGSGLI